MKKEEPIEDPRINEVEKEMDTNFDMNYTEILMLELKLCRDGLIEALHKLPKKVDKKPIIKRIERFNLFIELLAFSHSLNKIDEVESHKLAKRIRKVKDKRKK